MLVTVDLTQEEAEAFKDWRQYQDRFEVLIKAGVFKTNTGKVLLHFRDNQIEQVGIDVIAWRRKT